MLLIKEFYINSIQLYETMKNRTQQYNRYEIGFLVKRRLEEKMLDKMCASTNVEGCQCTQWCSKSLHMERPHPHTN